MPHEIVHIEIPVTNLEKAKDFYSSIFGWNVEVYEGYSYAGFKTGKPPNGGFREVKSVKGRNNVFFYIRVDNIDAKIREIIEAGGKIVRKKTSIPSGGWDAEFADIFGNVIGLYQRSQK
jgi:hypothetical protein